MTTSVCCYFTTATKTTNEGNRVSNLYLDKLSSKMRRPDPETWRQARLEIIAKGRRQYSEYQTAWEVGSAIRHTILIPVRILAFLAGFLLLFISYIPQILFTLVVLGATWFVGVFIYAGFQ
jgi:hypothetical protein